MVDNDGFTLRDEPGDHVDVLRDGDPVARYMYAYDPTAEGAHETAKPYLHVLDPSTGAPITKGPGGKYTHHRGIFVGWNEFAVGGETYDFWHMDDSDIVHRSFDRSEEFPATGALISETDWVTAASETVLTERRTHTFRRPPTDDGIVVVDLTSRLEPTDAPVDLEGDPEHAGVQYRAHNAVAENESADYVFPPGTFADPTPSTDAIAAEGGLPWVAMTYRIEDRTYAVQQMNHPDNPPGTTYSAYRPYGRFGAFFEASLAADESLTVRYRFVVERGDAPAPETLDERYAAFVD
jgi:hypothetical protein